MTDAPAWRIDHAGPLNSILSDLPVATAPLSAAQVRVAVTALLDARIADDEKQAFLLALRRRGERPDEIAFFASMLLDHAIDPGIDPARMSGPMIDVCGTGGDGLDLFNVSTTAMFIVAAGGACIVKHGNRAITSRSGGADVLTALGVPTQLPPAAARQRLQRDGLVFLFAPDYHPAFRAVAPVRRRLAELGERSVFNLLGPLLNPARPAHQLAGVFAPEFVPVYAEVYALLGRTHAWAVHGEVSPGRGTDEISPLGPTLVSVSERGVIGNRVLHPADFGFVPAGDLSSLRGGDAEENARIVAGILRGQVTDLRRDIVLMNAAAAFVVSGLAADLPAGVERARAQIETGAAARKLDAARG